MYIIFGNYGDNTIALIQWCHLQKIESVSVVHVATGWGDETWQKRVTRGQQLAQQYHYKTVTLTPAKTFPELILEQKNFPTAKYQWCPTFLKAMPLLAYLEEHDAENQAIIMLGSRRADSRARFQLSEFIEESDYYGERKVWYPLFDLSNAQRDILILQAGFKILNQRSLECNPCIHKCYNDFTSVDSNIVTTISMLEKKLQQTLFEQPFTDVIIENSDQKKTHDMEGFDLGCGARYVCGE